MPGAGTRTSNRTLAAIALGLVGALLGIQAVVFAIWGNDGDPPDAVVAGVLVSSLGSVFGLVAVIAMAVRRRTER